MAGFFLGLGTLYEKCNLNVPLKNKLKTQELLSYERYAKEVETSLKEEKNYTQTT